MTEAAHVKVEAETLGGIRQALKNGFLAERLKKYHGDKAARLLSDWGAIWLSVGFSTWSIEPTLAQITCPALVLQGDADAYATTQHMYDIAHQIGPNAQPLLVANAGHMPHQQAQAAVLAATTQFVDEALG